MTILASISFAGDGVVIAIKRQSTGSNDRTAEQRALEGEIANRLEPAIYEGAKKCMADGLTKSIKFLWDNATITIKPNATIEPTSGT